jgi:Fe-S cluster biogenesis protein NfuA
MAETTDPELRQRIERLLDEMRPYLQADGGEVELLGVERGVVRLKLQGACKGCPSSSATVEHGIKIRLLEAIPELTEVVAC